MSEERELKLSFMSKKEYVCPVCGKKFNKEELLTGGGRLIAGALTEELHRLFEPSSKYGDVYPLAYCIVVCPSCWFASTEADFPLIPNGRKEAANKDTQKRKEETLTVFPGIDFTNPRGLMEGAASHYLTLRCYDFFGSESSPTIKRGIAALRTAWMLDKLHGKLPKENYDWLGVLFRKKAQYFYSAALHKEQQGEETMSALKNFGPDIDKNYGYEGMLYTSAYLRYKYGPQTKTVEEHILSLDEAKRTIAKLFGMGGKSKDKPGAFLDLVRKSYNAINEEIEALKAKQEAN